MTSHIASSIHGSTGGITYSTGLGHPINLRARTIPTPRNFSLRRQYHNLFQGASALWNQLATSHRKAWDDFGTEKNTTGRSIFISTAANACRGAPRTLTSPISTFQLYPFHSKCAIRLPYVTFASSSQISWRIYNIAPISVRVYFYCSIPFSKAHGKIGTQFRWIQSYSYYANPGGNFTQTVTPLIPNSRYFFKFIIVFYTTTELYQIPSLLIPADTLP